MSTQENSPLIEQIQHVLAAALRLSEDAVSPALEFGDVPQWDSLGHMEVMMELEQNFGIEINADTIATLISIPAIHDYIIMNKQNG